MRKIFLFTLVVSLSGFNLAQSFDSKKSSSNSNINSDNNHPKIFENLIKRDGSKGFFVRPGTILSGCFDRQQECFEQICAKLSPYGCDSLDKAAEVQNACRGNISGMCMTAACSMVGNYECNDRSQVLAIATACRGNPDDTCLKSICAKLNTNSCNELTKIISVAKVCGGTKDFQ